MLTSPTLSPTASPAALPAHASALSGAGRMFIAVMLITVLEGAARKWLSPSATLPLVLLRDLLAVWLVMHAWTQGRLRQLPVLCNLLLGWSLCVVGWGLLQLSLGESSPTVFLIGLRFWLLYLWFAVAAAASMNPRDLHAALRVLLATMALMTPLVLLQHHAPPGAFVNRGIDPDEEDIFLVISGVVRTTGTFSFTAGYTAFLALCTPFVLGALEAPKRRNGQRLHAFVLFICLAVSCLVSGARGAIIVMGSMLALHLVLGILNAPARKKATALLGMALLLLALGTLAYLLQDAVEALQERFEVASESEDLLARISQTFFGGSSTYAEIHWLGRGVGLGSNLAQYVQTGARTVFALAETEPARILLEGGLLGMAWIALKYLLIAAAMLASLKQSLRWRTLLPVLTWTMISLALVTWPFIGQLSANALLGLLVGLGLLILRYPAFRLYSRSTPG